MSSATRQCARLEPLLSAYVDHEASPSEMAEVEGHLASCGECTARLRRLQRLSPMLDLQLQGLLASGEAEARRLNRGFRLPPAMMLAEPPSTPLLARLATVAVALAIAGVLAIVLMRTPPSVQTAAPPPTVAAPTTGPIVTIAIDGLVDPPTAAYVQRALSQAAQQHAALVTVGLSPSAGLDSSTHLVAQSLSDSTVPTAAYLPTGRNNATALALAAATNGTVDAIPHQAEPIEMDVQEAVWHRLLDPTTAYVFFVLGLYAVLLEIAHPGAVLPGITGTLCLLAAAIAFVTLPTNWLGVLAVIGGVGLTGLELHAGRHGLLILCGTLCLGLGSLVLFPVVIAPWVLAAMVLAGLALGIAIVRVARRIQQLPPLSGLERLIGARGVARTGLDPDGVVHVQGQLWSAHLRGPALARGEAVRVLARHGLILEVEPANFRAAATQKGQLS